MVYGSTYLRRHCQTSHFLFQKKHGKHDDHTMTMVWIMENMVIIPWSCHESWRPWQETWPTCRQHGMIMIIFRHIIVGSWQDHGKIMPRSWPGSHVFPTREHQCHETNDMFQQVARNCECSHEKVAEDHLKFFWISVFLEFWHVHLLRNTQRRKWENQNSLVKVKRTQLSTKIFSKEDKCCFPVLGNGQMNVGV